MSTFSTVNIKVNDQLFVTGTSSLHLIDSQSTKIINVATGSNPADVVNFLQMNNAISTATTSTYTYVNNQIASATASAYSYTNTQITSATGSLYNTLHAEIGAKQNAVITLSGDVTGSGTNSIVATVSNVKVTNVTGTPATQIPYGTSAGLTSSSNHTWDNASLVGTMSGTFSVAQLLDSALTSTRLVYTTTNGRLIDNVRYYIDANGFNIDNVSGGTSPTIYAKANVGSTTNIYGSFYGQISNSSTNTITIQQRLERSISTGTPAAGMGQSIYFTQLNHATSALLPANKIGSSWYACATGVNKSKLSLWAQDATDANVDNLLEILNVSQNGTYLGGSWSAVTNTTVASAILHLAPGTATASNAPLKFTSGTNLTTTEAGAVEYNGSHLYFTATASGPRYQLDNQVGSNLFLYYNFV